MKNIVSKVSIAMVLSQLWVLRVLAALSDPPNDLGLATSVSSPTELKTFIVKYLKIVLDFVTLFGVIYVIIAGIRLIVSGGDEGEKDKAKKTILYVVIGILVVVFARVIVTFVAGLPNATAPGVATPS